MVVEHPVPVHEASVIADREDEGCRSDISTLHQYQHK